MHKRRVHYTWFLAISTLLITFIAGCGRETINVPDTTPPYVLSTIPAQGAAGVALNAPISATFSEAVAPSTVSASTFTVTAPGGPVAGTVSMTGNTATFTPTGLLAQDTNYTGTITNAVKDLAGNAIVQNYVWNFEIVEVPSVASTSPATGATGVGINQTIAANFQIDPDSANSALNCSTLTAATFTVTAATGPVTGTVACSGASATFTPSMLLAQDTTYTATLTTGVQNAAGSSLPSPYVWSFATGAQPVVISTLPASNATGVPLSQSISAMFSKMMNCATLFAPAKTFTLMGPG